MSIGIRLLLAFAIALLPVFAMESYNSYALYQARYSEIQRLALQQALAAAADTNQIIEGTRGLLNAVAQTNEIDAADATTCSIFLKAMVKTAEPLSSISVADEKGNIVCSSFEPAKNVNIADRQYFTEATNSHDVVVGTYILGRSDNQPILPVAIARTRLDGTRTGVVVGAIDLNWLAKHIDERGYAQGGSVTIADRNGTILARQPLAQQFMGKSIPPEFFHLLKDTVPGNFEALSRDGSRRIYGYVPLSVPPAGLYVSTGLSTELSFAALRQSIFRELATFLLVLLVSTLIALIANQMLISKPVNTILGTVRRWQSGDTSARTGMTSDTGELGKIGEEFDRAAASLVAREKTINLLQGELQHRAKNQLAVISAFVRQISKKEQSVEGFRIALDQRLQSLARSQDLLLNSDNGPVNLEDVLRAQMQTFELENSPRVTLRGEPIQLSPNTARNIGMAAHELLTNALKHGALSTEHGKVEIDWHATDKPNEVTLQWREVHARNMVEPRSSGFGRVMIESVIPQMLNGTSKLSFDRPGLAWTISFLNDA